MKGNLFKLILVLGVTFLFWPNATTTAPSPLRSFEYSGAPLNVTPLERLSIQASEKSSNLIPQYEMVPTDYSLYPHENMVRFGWQYPEGAICAGTGLDALSLIDSRGIVLNTTAGASFCTPKISGEVEQVMGVPLVAFFEICYPPKPGDIATQCVKSPNKETVLVADVSTQGTNSNYPVLNRTTKLSLFSWPNYPYYEVGDPFADKASFPVRGKSTYNVLNRELPKQSYAKVTVINHSTGKSTTTTTPWNIAKPKSFADYNFVPRERGVYTILMTLDLDKGFVYNQVYPAHTECSYVARNRARTRERVRVCKTIPEKTIQRTYIGKTFKFVVN